METYITAVVRTATRGPLKGQTYALVPTAGVGKAFKVITGKHRCDEELVNYQAAMAQSRLATLREARPVISAIEAYYGGSVRFVKRYHAG